MYEKRGFYFKDYERHELQVATTGYWKYSFAVDRPEGLHTKEKKKKFQYDIKNKKDSVLRRWGLRKELMQIQ